MSSSREDPFEWGEYNLTICRNWLVDATFEMQKLNDRGDQQRAGVLLRNNFRTALNNMTRTLRDKIRALLRDVKERIYWAERTYALDLVLTEQRFVQGLAEVVHWLCDIDSYGIKDSAGNSVPPEAFYWQLVKLQTAFDSERKRLRGYNPLWMRAVDDSVDADLAFLQEDVSIMKVVANELEDAGNALEAMCRFSLWRGKYPGRVMKGSRDPKGPWRLSDIAEATDDEYEDEMDWRNMRQATLSPTSETSQTSQTEF